MGVWKRPSKMCNWIVLVHLHNMRSQTSNTLDSFLTAKMITKEQNQAKRKKKNENDGKKAEKKEHKHNKNAKINLIQFL